MKTMTRINYRYNNMTIKEAIKHCEEVALRDCSECALEHRQLAEWLRELRQLKIISSKIERRITMDEQKRKSLDIQEEEFRRIVKGIRYEKQRLYLKNWWQNTKRIILW